MRSSKIFFALLAVAALAILPACGGGGNGFPASAADPLVIMATSLPAGFTSGDSIDWEIPLEGGCSGPYVVELIAGSLPLGLGFDDVGGRHHLTGYILENGIFSFTVKVTDTSCTPFFTTTQAFVWEVPIGALRIVGANNGVGPALILNAAFNDPAKWEDADGPDGVNGTADDNTPGFTIDALETTVFSQFAVYNLIVAGGVAPYTCALIDDPADPNDGALPLGANFAPNSCSILGTPSQVLPGGVPFRITVRVTDAASNVSTRKFQWKIDTPPIIIANNNLVDGQAGATYSDGIQIVDGVPPFAFELTDSLPDDDGSVDTTSNQHDDITYPPGMTPIVNSLAPGSFGAFALTSGGPTDVATLHGGIGMGRVDYPADADNGPNYGPFHSEGIQFRRAGAGAGSFSGIPRRVGTFEVFVHTYSTLVPNERGQHAFKRLSCNIAQSDPLEISESLANEGTFSGPTLPSDGFPTLPEAEVRVIYNPDVSTGHAAEGMELRATGGVVHDGKFDQAHEGENLGVPAGELAGKYGWTGDMNADGNGDLAPNFRVYQPFGILGTETIAEANALQRSGRRQVSLTVEDAQLPLSVRNTDSQIFGISIGPDAVIITETTLTATNSTATGTNDISMEHGPVKVRLFQVVAGSGTVADLAPSDLSTGTTIPSEVGSLTLAQVLSGAAGGNTGVELMRPTLNPNGWWCDNFNMNPKGGRATARTDKQTAYNYQQVNGWNNSGGGWHLNSSALELPKTTNAMNPAAGIRNDGGLLYAFRTTSASAPNGTYGFFIVRRNASIYIPWAADAGDSASGLSCYKFGDGDVTRSRDSNFQMVPMSVSPNGRTAVAKIVGTTSDTFSTVSNWSLARFVLISLTGEKFANGKTYCYINPNLTTTGGNYMYSTSMVLTDNHMYFLTGTYNGHYASWRDHWIHRFEYANPSTGAWTADDSGSAPLADLAPAAVSNTRWTQSGTSTPMQTPFQKWDNINAVRRLSGFSSSGTTFSTVTQMDDEMYIYDGSNFLENALAPVPFRVSADGQHCALLAGPRSSGTSGSDVMSHYVWVDSYGDGFRQISSNTSRHCPQGAGRGSSLRRGPSSYRHWGSYGGPTTGFEISDDGRNVAVCYNTISSVSSTSATSNYVNNREDILAYRATGTTSSPWTGTTGEKLVTSNTFGGTIKWRFGSLLFTKDNDGLIFWGGASSRNPTSTSTVLNRYVADSHSTHFTGTYYSYDMTSGGSGTTATVRGVMPTSAGGIGTFPTYDGTAGGSSSPFSPAVGSWVANHGYIKPLGGFLSVERDYFYVVNMHANNGGDQTMNTLLGINIENLSASSTPSGHQKGRGFKPTGYPSRRGFLPNYHYSPHEALERNYYNPHHVGGAAMQVMNEETGNVYFMTHYSRSGPTRSTSTFASGPQTAVYWQDYGSYGFEIEAFSGNVGGPIARLSDFNGNTSTRDGHYMIVSPKGDKVSAVYGEAGSTVRYHNRERVMFVRNISFHPTTGVIDGSFDKTDADQVWVMETSAGRAGESLAFDSGGSKLFYSWTTGTNENAKQLVQMTFNPTTGAKTYLRVSPTRRYIVLWAGR